jgi:hypothetical protein
MTKKFKKSDLIILITKILVLLNISTLTVYYPKYLIDSKIFDNWVTSIVLIIVFIINCIIGYYIFYYIWNFEKKNKFFKKIKIHIYEDEEDGGYYSFGMINDNFICTEAETLEGLKLKSLEAVNLIFEKEEVVYTMEDLKFILKGI